MTVTSNTATYRKAMRALGYSAGRAGRPAAKVDAHYQASWRRGREARRKFLAGEAASDG